MKNKKDKVQKVMREFYEGKLKTSHGEKVTDPKQAVAIGYSEQRAKDKMSSGGTLEVNPSYEYKNIVKRWLEDNSPDGLKYKIAVKLLKGETNAEEELNLENKQYDRLLRSLEKAGGESKHEMSWRTLNYSTYEAEQWATEALNKFFVLKPAKDKMEDGATVSEKKEKTASEFVEQIKSLMKQQNKWHFLGETVDGKKVRMKFFVGKKEVDVQIFTIDNLGVTLPRNYSSRKDTTEMIASRFGIEKKEFGGGIDGSSPETTGLGKEIGRTQSTDSESFEDGVTITELTEDETLFVNELCERCSIENTNKNAIVEKINEALAKDSMTEHGKKTAQCVLEKYVDKKEFGGGIDGASPETTGLGKEVGRTQSKDSESFAKGATVKKDKHVTEVKFLYNEANEDLFAYFPKEDEGNGMKMMYSHVGQHSAGSPEYAKESRLATKEEYSDLEQELEGLGYNLLVLNEAGKKYSKAMKNLHKKVTEGEEQKPHRPNKMYDYDEIIARQAAKKRKK